MSEPNLRPAVSVPPEEVCGLLAGLEAGTGILPADPEQLLISMTVYVLVLQGVLNYAGTSIQYFGVLSSISDAAAAVLRLTPLEAPTALKLLLRLGYFRRDKARLLFPRLRDHLRPPDFFWRIGPRESLRRRQLRPALPLILQSAQSNALEAYAAWSSAVPWAPELFSNLRGSWERRLMPPLWQDEEC